MNQTIRVSSKFQRNDIIDFDIIVVLLSLKTLFEAKRLVIAILLMKNAWYLQTKSTKRLKHPNRTVNLQAFVKIAINSNITAFFYTIYRVLKLQYRPALCTMYTCTL